MDNLPGLLERYVFPRFNPADFYFFFVLGTVFVFSIMRTITVCTFYSSRGTCIYFMVSGTAFRTFCVAMTYFRGVSYFETVRAYKGEWNVCFNIYWFPSEVYLLGELTTEEGQYKEWHILFRWIGVKSTYFHYSIFLGRFENFL